MTIRFDRQVEVRVFRWFLLGLLLFVSACDLTEGPAQPPNVLFIAVDDLRPELGAYGQTHVVSPNIDALAASGVTFTRAYTQQAVCNPSRASLMTGLRPDALRVWDLQTHFRDTRPEVVTLPQYFKQHGYHTAAIGKIYHNTLPDTLSWSEPKMYLDGYPFDPDAVYRGEESVAWLAQRKAEIIAEGRKDRYIDQFGEWYLKAAATEAPDVPDSAYYDGAQTDAALKKLQTLNEGGKPFFFAVGYYRPHLPFNAPKQYWDLYNRSEIPLPDNPFVPEEVPLMAMNTMSELNGYTDFRGTPHPTERGLTEAQTRLLRHGYYASVSYIDAQVGRLLAELDRLGLRDNTIVVLWGDHGWKLGEHNSWAKMTNFEIDTRAPLIIRAPDARENGTAVEGLVEYVDIYPTLTELAGLPIPDSLEGMSMVPLLIEGDRPWKEAVFSQFLREGIWVAPDSVAYMGYSIRTERYRYVEWVNWESGALSARELYDHQQDPGENRNLADDPAQATVLEELARRLEAGWQRAGPPFGL